jgi:hypothetical protein
MQNNKLTDSENKYRILAEVPSCSGVYIIRIPGIVLYVGQSVCIKNRIKAHFDSFPMVRCLKFSDLSIECLPTTDRLNKEKELIEKLQPLFNNRSSQWVGMEIKSILTGKTYMELLEEEMAQETDGDLLMLYEIIKKQRILCQEMKGQFSARVPARDEQEV